MGTTGIYIIGFIVTFILYGLLTDKWGYALIAALLWPAMIAFLVLSLYYGIGKFLD